MKLYRLKLVAGCCGILGLILASFSPPLAAVTAQADYDYSQFARLPIQHQGRLKPLDTYARIQLELLAEQERLDDLSAVAWLAEVLFSPEAAYQRELFKVTDRDLKLSLELPERANQLYSFGEVSRALQDQQELVEVLSEQEFSELSSSSQELLNLAQKSLIFFELSRTMSLFAKVFQLNDPQTAAALGLVAGNNYNFLQVINSRPLLVDLVNNILAGQQAAPGRELSAAQIEILAFANTLETINNDKNSLSLKLLPGQWQSSWTSPWENISSGDGTPFTALLFGLWQELAQYYTSPPNAVVALNWQQATRQLLTATLEGSAAQAWQLNLEIMYNRLPLFRLGMFLYILTLLSAGCSFILSQRQLSITRLTTINPALLHNAALWLLFLGLALQLAGLVIRMLILARPPVATFYESLLFVTAMSVLGGGIFELIKYDYRGLLLAALSGGGLSALGFYNLEDGDSMLVLSAVLNSSYWLATHVLVISLGYAAAILTAVLAHCYLVANCFSLARMPQTTRPQQQAWLQPMFILALVSLFLMTLGTVLGAIWADQSWGRFWGWDPKENGALLIILWLVICIHGRLTNFGGQRLFVLGLATLGITVALSWFGVNLLGIGLHSYGFIDNTALLALLAFIAAELVFLLALVCIENLLKRRHNYAD